MSLNDQKRITFKFNKTNMPKIAKILREEYNKQQDFIYDFALRLQEYAKKQKIKTEHDLIVHLEKISYGRVSFPNANNTGVYAIQFYSDTFHKIVRELYSAKDNKLRKPRKSSFPKLTSKDKTFNIEFCHESGVCILSGQQRVVFDTDYNNHSADALNNEFPQHLIRILMRHKWGRGEGGFSQYRSENHYVEYMGDDYPEIEIMSNCWGKLGEEIRKDQEKHHKLMAKAYR